MKVEEFIIDVIKELVKVFPNTKVRYENHIISNTHFIEVIPSDFYKFNEGFQRWEEEATFNFINQFPNQNITFLTDDDLVGIENVNFELKGDLYDLLHFYNNQNYNNIQISQLSNSNLNNSLTTINNNENRVLLNDIQDCSIIFSRHNSNNQLISYKDLKLNKPTLHNILNTKFALAA